ncbi:MAG: hypothetical protein PUB43_02590 [Oscillospiraceae bacterium]|nr:hypothetical protein [Oscillospiraceae bacterium]
MARLDLEAKEIDELIAAIKQYPGNAEKAINDVLHKEASPILQDSIKKLIPVSGRQWKGKKPPASAAKSLTDDTKENLAVTVKTTKNYHYLYFPDDGTNTDRHQGNQQFFHRGGENKKSDIIGRCIARMAESFENQ